jgi:hypothetical protein
MSNHGAELKHEPIVARSSAVSCLGTRVSDPDPDWMRIQSGPWIRIRIQEGKNDPQKFKKVKTFHVFKCWIFSFEG